MDIPSLLRNSNRGNGEVVTHKKVIQHLRDSLERLDREDFDLFQKINTLKDQTVLHENRHSTLQKIKNIAGCLVVACPVAAFLLPMAFPGALFPCLGLFTASAFGLAGAHIAQKANEKEIKSLHEEILGATGELRKNTGEREFFLNARNMVDGCNENCSDCVDTPYIEVEGVRIPMRRYQYLLNHPDNL